MIDWNEGVTYRISTKDKKNIVMINTYYKKEDYDQKIFIKEAYRSGWVEVLGDEMSYYLDDTYDPKIGIDVWCFPMTDHEILDGVVGDFSFSDNVPGEEVGRLKPLITEKGKDILEDMGWEFEDTEVWFYGDLSIEAK